MRCVIGLPGVNWVVRSAIAIGSCNGWHTRCARGLDVADVIANIETTICTETRLLCCVQQGPKPERQVAGVHHVTRPWRKRQGLVVATAYCRRLVAQLLANDVADQEAAGVDGVHDGLGQRRRFVFQQAGQHLAA